MHQNGSLKWDVNVREKEGLVNFMKDPKEPPPPPPPEAPWKDTPSEVIHLDAETFRTTLRRKKHALVMFYAPCLFFSYSRVSLNMHVVTNRNNFSLSLTGCGHCKAAKPEFVSAAEHFKDDPKVTDSHWYDYSPISHHVYMALVGYAGGIWSSRLHS